MGGITELIRWMAFFDLYPPEQIAWERASMLAHVIYRMGGGKKLKQSDFMPKFGAAMVQTVEEQVELFDNLGGD